ncbi:UNVERIFIED_CONTAM: hypothetical protein GTU68_013638 [Idotea baltica]|nr:hypothetical protein [Idotea baltica]
MQARSSVTLGSRPLRLLRRRVNRRLQTTAVSKSTRLMALPVSSPPTTAVVITTTRRIGNGSLRSFALRPTANARPAFAP